MLRLMLINYYLLVLILITTTNKTNKHNNNDNNNNNSGVTAPRVASSVPVPSYPPTTCSGSVVSAQDCQGGRKKQRPGSACAPASTYERYKKMIAERTR